MTPFRNSVKEVNSNRLLRVGHKHIICFINLSYSYFIWNSSKNFPVKTVFRKLLKMLCWLWIFTFVTICQTLILCCILYRTFFFVSFQLIVQYRYLVGVLCIHLIHSVVFYNPFYTMFIPSYIVLFHRHNFRHSYISPHTLQMRRGPSYSLN